MDFISPFPVFLQTFFYAFFSRLHSTVPGNNGTIDGQVAVWWELFVSRNLNHSRPHLVEFISCNDITISYLNLLELPCLVLSSGILQVLANFLLVGSSFIPFLINQNNVFLFGPIYVR